MDAAPGSRTGPAAGPWRAAGQGPTLADLLQGYGEEMKKVGNRRAFCMLSEAWDIVDRQPGLRSKMWTARRSPVRACSLTTPGRWAPTLPVPAGAVSVGIAFPRTPTRSHLAPVRTRLRHPGSPNSPCMSPGDLEAVHPSPARARAGAARRESLTGAGCRRSGPTNPSRLGF